MARKCHYCRGEADPDLGYSDVRSSHRCRACNLTYGCTHGVDEAQQALSWNPSLEEVRRAVEWIRRNGAGGTIRKMLESRLRRLEREQNGGAK